MRVPRTPPTMREDTVDVIGGERVPDPYRWLEDDASARVRDWTDAQNARTRAALAAIPQRAHFARRLRELLSVGLLSTPRPVAGRIFHARREGDQKQSLLYLRESSDAPDRVLVDPNAMDAAGRVKPDWGYPAPAPRNAPPGP